MAKKSQLMQALIRQYKQATGKTEIDMHEVAKFAAGKGWRLPKPPGPLDILAKEFSKAAREEHRRDSKTGRSYRANHAFTQQIGSQQLTLWVDIDEAPRKPMFKALQQRREQMVGDALQLSLDAEHWNNVHTAEEPINIELDFTDDVEWRKNSDVDDVAS
jgi:hypothetical protein